MSYEKGYANDHGVPDNLDTPEKRYATNQQHQEIKELWGNETEDEIIAMRADEMLTDLL